MFDSFNDMIDKFLRKYGIYTRITLYFLVVVISVTATVIPRSMLLDRIQIEENESSVSDVNLLRRAVKAELHALSTMCADYSVWDDSYQFALDGNHEFIDSNLEWEVLDTNSKINLFYVYNTSKELVYGAAAAQIWGGTLDYSPFFNDPEYRKSILVDIEQDPEERKNGFLVTKEGIMMIASQQILKSDRSGPPSGTLVMGRVLSDEVLNDLAERIGLKIKFRNSAEKAFSNEDMIRAKYLESKDFQPEVFDNDILFLHTMYPDLMNKSKIIATIEKPRTIMQRGKKSVLLISFFLFCSSVLLGFILVSSFLSYKIQTDRDRRRLESEVYVRDERIYNREHLLDSIAQICGKLISEEDFDKTMETCLDLLGNVTKSSRVYIFYNSIDPMTGQLLMSQKYEWTDGQATPQINNPKLQNSPYESYPDLLKNLQKSEPYYGIVDLMEDNQTRDVLMLQDIKSVAIVPIKSKGEFIGFLGLDDCEIERVWTVAELNVLMAVAGSIGNAIWRHRSQLDLAKAESRLRTILDSVQTGIILIDMKSHEIVDANPAALEMYGGQLTSLLHHCCSHVICPAEEDECPLMNSDNKMINSEQILLRKDGSRLPVLKTVTRVELDGKPYLLESFVDLTQQKQLETDLVRAKEAADVANRAKSAFLANMSHEIRTPMNAIIGYTQLLERDNETTPNQREFLATIANSGQHLLSLINDILEMSKIEAGKVVIDSHPFSPSNMLDDLEAMFNLHAKSKNLSLLVERIGTIPEFINADEKKIRQVIVNLLSNAIKFTENGGIAMRVMTQTPPWRFVIEVEDTGCGIAENDIDRIFDPFEQGCRAVATSEGTGLGMPISRHYARMLGGDLTVKSVPGVGSRFRFEFHAESTAAHKPEERQKIIYRVKGISPSWKPFRVLVVDDRPTNRHLLGLLLSNLGFSIKEASSGEESLRLYKEWSPQIVLLDRQMPGMDGLETMARMRALQNGNRIPIVMVTASAMEEHRQEVLVKGADGFIRKPYREEEVLEEIQRLTGIEYIYGEPINHRKARSNGYQNTDIQSVNISSKLKATIAHLIESGEWYQIMILIDELADENPEACKALKEAAQNFDYKKLTHMIS